MLNLSPEQLGNISSLATVLMAAANLILVIYYARLFKENKEQTKAQKAAYTPKIDAIGKIKDNKLAFKIINRGNGIASNIELKTKIETSRLRNYELKYKMEESLDSHKKINNPENPSGYLKLDPEFLLEVKEGEKIKEDLKSLFNYEREKEGTFELDDLEFLNIKVNLTYTDILEDKKYTEELIDNGLICANDELQIYALGRPENYKSVFYDRTGTRYQNLFRYWRILFISHYRRRKYKLEMLIYTVKKSIYGIGKKIDVKEEVNMKVES